MISLLGSKKAAFGPPGCTLVIKIQKTQIQTHTNTCRSTKKQKQKGSVLGKVPKKMVLFGTLSQTMGRWGSEVPNFFSENKNPSIEDSVPK